MRKRKYYKPQALRCNCSCNTLILVTKLNQNFAAKRTAMATAAAWQDLPTVNLQIKIKLNLKMRNSIPQYNK